MLREGWLKLCVGTVAIVLLASSSYGATINWTDWASGAVSTTAGVAQGLAGGVAVTYSGELEGLFVNYPAFSSATFANAPFGVGMLPSWSPSNTFTSAAAANAPTSSNGFIGVFGQQGTVNTITFATAVVDPVMAFWSLGASGGTNTGQGRNCLIASLPGCTARAVFNASFSILGGGASAEYGGSSVFTLPGYVNTLFGTEGNGVIQFHGTFTSLSWTNPDFESWSGFTVGVPVAPIAPVPEPQTLLLVCTGGLLIGARRIRSRRPHD